MKLILASNNKGKLCEIKELLDGTNIELLSQREAGLELDVEENGTTFDENSFIKAKAVTDILSCAAVADDSGLMVDALGGEPGVYSARYGPGHSATDEQRYSYLLSKLENVTDRTARFVCCICCTMPDGTVLRARGECEGTILKEPRGENGFGYDPIFKPCGFDRSMAELESDEKNAISHRGKALRLFAEELKRYYNGTDK